MEKRPAQNLLPKTSSPSTDRQIMSPVDTGFNIQVLKLKMTDIVDIALVHKPKTLYRQFLDNEEMTIDIVKLMLIQLQDFYNCKSKMTDAQLTESAYLICGEYRHFNYYDIGMCLKLAKTREKVYDRVDGGMVLNWLKQFDIDRNNLIMIERQNQKAKQDGEWSSLGDRSSVVSLKSFLSD